MNPLDYFRFDMLSAPWVLYLLPLVLVLLLLELLAGAPGAMTVSTGEVIAHLRGKGRAYLRRVPPLLRAAGLALLIIALAGPLHGFQIRRDRANIIDIMLAVDVSGSMAQKDFVVNGRPEDRLFVTKQAVRDFINNRKARYDDRFGMDRVGLILYAGYAWTAAPLTLDYAIIEREVEMAGIDNTNREKEGTAIGSAIGLAVSRLKDSPAKSKVIVLLTDGLNNRGEIDPMTAAAIAQRFDVRIYTIGAGSTEPGFVPGFLFPQQGQPIDEETMSKIAETTGGRYFRAKDLNSLLRAYEEINQMEATEVDAGDYYEYKPAFLPWLLTGAAALLASVFARRRWFEVLP